MEKTDRENSPVASDEQPAIQKSTGGEDIATLLAKLQEKEAEAKGAPDLGKLFRTGLTWEVKK